MNGIINVYKEAGYTSFDVVAKLRGILREKKIGHTGTLDPQATGVLPVCVGKATKVCALLTDKDKTYEATMELGVTTDTQDATGTVLTECREAAGALTEDAVRRAIMEFVGTYQQIPPMYSALKVGGRKLCDLAREGIEVERKARPVTIYEIRILEMKLPLVRFAVHCSKGTYIRTLCADIGERLGVGGRMNTLVRTQVSRFTLEQAVTLEQIEQYRDADRLSEILQPVDLVFSDHPAYTVRGTEEQEPMRKLKNGNRLSPEELCPSEPDRPRVRIYDKNGHFYGIYGWDEAAGAYKCVKMFL